MEDNNAKHDISLFDVLSTYASIASNNAHANAMSRYNKHTPELEVLKLGREIRDLNAVTGEISRPIFVNSEMSNKTRESITSTHAYARPDSACQVNIDEPQLRAIDAKINHGNLQKDLIKKIAIQHEIAHCSDPFVQFVNSTNNTPDSVGHSNRALFSFLSFTSIGATHFTCTHPPAIFLITFLISSAHSSPSQHPQLILHSTYGFPIS